jgi:hypothetical protein
MSEAFKIADAYVQVETRYDRDQMRRDLDEMLRGERDRMRRRGRDDIGGPLGEGAADGLGDGLRNGLRRRRGRDNDIIRRWISPFIIGFVKAASLGFANVNLERAFINNPAIAAAGLAIGALLVTWTAAGIAATLAAALAGALGLGIIGLGVYLLRGEPQVRAAAKRLGKTFKEVFTGAAKPMLGPIVASLNIFTAAIKKNQPLIDKLFKTLSPAIVPLAKGLTGFLEALGPGLQALAEVGRDVLIDLAEHLPGWGKSIGDFFQKIHDNWPEIKESLEAFFRDLGKVLGFLAGVFLWLARNYEELRDTLFASITTTIGIVKAIKDAATSVKNSINAIIGYFAGLPGGILSKIRGLWSKIRFPFDALHSGMRINAISAVSAFVGVIAGLPSRALAGVRALWARIRGPFDGARTGVITLGSNLVAGFVRIVYTLPTRALRAISRLKGLFFAYFSGAGNWLWNAGSRIIGGLISGVRSRIAELRGVFSGVTNLIPSWKGPEERDKKLLTPSGEMIMDGLMEGIKSRLPTLKMQLTGVSAGIPQAVQDQAPKQYMSTASASTTNHISIPVSVTVPAGTDGTRIGREVAREIRKALDDFDRSVKR